MDRKVYLIEAPQLERSIETAQGIAHKMETINTNVAAAYDVCEERGATMPAKQNTANLAGTIDSIPSGSTEAPTLYAPTLSRNNDTINISNPSTNGGYVSGYRIYNGNSVIKEQSSTSLSLISLGAGTYELYVSATGLGFKNSPKSNRIKASVFTITRSLTNLTANNSTSLISNGLSYTVTLSPASGYYLPEDITVTIGGKAGYFEYDSYTGVITLPSVNGNVVITAAADTVNRLRRPTISISGSTLSITPPRYAESTKLYIDGTLIQTYTGTTTVTYDLSTDYSAYGIYAIKVQSEAAGYENSREAELTYTVGPTIKITQGVITVLDIISGITGLRVYIDGVGKDIRSYDGSASWCVDMSSYEQSTEDGKHSVQLAAIGSGVADNRSNAVAWFCGTAPIYGVSGMYNSAPALTRTDDAVGMSYVINSSTGAVDSDFDDVFPWNEAEIVEDAAGKFIKMPDMFFRIGTDGESRITDIAVSSMPSGAGDWYEVPSFMYSCYLGYILSNKLVSKSGYAPAYNRTRAQFRTAAAANGNGYCQEDLYHATVMMFLWWIEFANKNSQAVMKGREYGTGTAGGSSRCNTGGTDGVETPSGFETVYGQMRWHDIEDWIGNMFRFRDGVCVGAWGGDYYVTNDPAKFADTTTEMVTLSYKAPNSVSNPCVAAYGWDADHPFMCLPCTVTNNGSYNTYFCDQFYLNGSSYPVLYCGSSYDHSARYGLSYGYSHSVGNSNLSLGARLLKLS